MKSTKNVNLSVNELNQAWSRQLQLKLISGEKGLKNKITSPRVQKPGLRIIEKDIKLEKGKVQIIGKTESAYLNKLSEENQIIFIKKLTQNKVPCFIFSKGTFLNKFLKDEFKKYGIPIFTASYGTGKLISVLNEFLSEKLAPKVNVHGVLLDIDRLGVLILGKSGVGKSESAIDLIIQGAKFIADDVVEIRKVSESKLVGSGPENIKFLIELRGIGIVNIKDLFGITSVMDKREIEMVIELDSWDSEKEYERLGIDNKTVSILDVELPHTIIPVSPGRNMAAIIEVAVRNQILKMSSTDNLKTTQKNILSSAL